MPLRDLQIQTIVSQGKVGKHADAGGLFLLVSPSGSAVWKLKYRVAGKEKKATFGPYPKMGLAAARRERDRFKAALLDGRDLLAEKLAAKAKAARAADDTFGHFAEQLLAHRASRQKGATQTKWTLHMSYAVAEFGKRPIAGITADEVLTFLLGFEERGLNSTARSIRQKMSAVFCRATLLGACNGDPTSVLKREMHPPRSTSHPAIIEPVKFGALLRAIWRYPHQGTRTALQLIALTFQRPHMVRAMRWEDINWAEARWELSAEQMKGAADVANDHIVPLSAQALQLLRDWYAICDRGSLVFPARGHVDKPLSPQAMSQALNALGYAGVHVPHGFRASANTLLLERLGYLQKTIDLQLAHIEENQVRRAYDRTAFLDSRIAMMQAWADYCDSLRRGGEVVPLKPATKRLKNQTK